MPLAETRDLLFKQGWHMWVSWPLHAAHWSTSPMGRWWHKSALTSIILHVDRQSGYVSTSIWEKYGLMLSWTSNLRKLHHSSACIIGVMLSSKTCWSFTHPVSPSHISSDQCTSNYEFSTHLMDLCIYVCSITIFPPTPSHMDRKSLLSWEDRRLCYWLIV